MNYMNCVDCYDYINKEIWNILCDCLLEKTEPATSEKITERIDLFLRRLDYDVIDARVYSIKATTYQNNDAVITIKYEGLISTFSICFKTFENIEFIYYFEPKMIDDNFHITYYEIPEGKRRIKAADRRSDRLS